MTLTEQIMALPVQERIDLMVAMIESVDSAAVDPKAWKDALDRLYPDGESGSVFVVVWWDDEEIISVHLSFDGAFGALIAHSERYPGVEFRGVASNVSERLHLLESVPSGPRGWIRKATVQP